MAKVLSCAEVDPSVRCSYVARGETDEEVLRKAAEHADIEHGVHELNPELEERIKAFIHEE